MIKYRLLIILFFLLLPVTCYQHVFWDYEIVAYRRNSISEVLCFKYFGHALCRLPDTNNF